jgi:hypothetical protein
MQKVNLEVGDGLSARALDDGQSRLWERRLGSTRRGGEQIGLGVGFLGLDGLASQ